MANSNTDQFPRSGHVLDPANTPFEIHTYTRENEVPRPHRRWELLDNPIHPLWRWQAWKDQELNPGEFDFAQVSQISYDQDDRRISRTVWDNMEATLRLATLLLQRARPFLTMLLTCPLVQVGPAEADLHFDPTWQIRKQDMDYLDDELLHFSHEYRLFRTPLQSVGNTFKLGITCCVKNTDADFLEFATKLPVVSAVASETMQEFEPGKWDSKPALDQFAVSLSLAQTLIHELAHAIFYRRKYLENIFQTDEDYAWWAGWEPQVFENQGNELGLEICRWLFGFEFCLPWSNSKPADEEARDIINPPSRPMLSGHHGLCAYKGLKWSPTELYMVSKKTLKWLFDKNMWTSTGPIPLCLIGPAYYQVVPGPVHDSMPIEPQPIDPQLIDPHIANPNQFDSNIASPDFWDPDLFEQFLLDPNRVDPDNIPTNPVDPNFNFVDPRLMDRNLTNPTYTDPNVVNPNDIDPNLVIPNFLLPRYTDPGLIEPDPVDASSVDPNYFDPNLIDPIILYLNLQDDDTGDDTNSTVPLGLNSDGTAYTFS